MARASRPGGTKIITRSHGSNKMNTKLREEIHKATNLASQLRDIMISLCFSQFEKTHFNIDVSDYDAPNELEDEQDARGALHILDKLLDSVIVDELINWDLELDGAL
jgi:hypothetical protein